MSRNPSGDPPGNPSGSHGELHPSARRVAEWAESKGLALTIQEYPEDGARTAEDAANAVGCQVDQIVKSMIFSLLTEDETNGAGGQPHTERSGPPHELVLALTSGSNKIDTAALAIAGGAARCGRADPEEVRSVTGYAIGGVPPFGHATALRTWIDPHLLTFDQVWAAAGTPRHVFPIDPARLVELTGAVEAPFTVA